MEAPIYFVFSSAGLERTHFNTRDAAVAHAETLKKYVAYRELTLGVLEVLPSRIIDAGDQVAVL